MLNVFTLHSLVLYRVLGNYPIKLQEMVKWVKASKNVSKTHGPVFLGFPSIQLKCLAQYRTEEIFKTTLFNKIILQTTKNFKMKTD